MARQGLAEAGSMRAGGGPPRAIVSHLRSWP